MSYIITCTLISTKICWEEKIEDGTAIGTRPCMIEEGPDRVISSTNNDPVFVAHHLFQALRQEFFAAMRGNPIKKV